jgi:hypothetical protein
MSTVQELEERINELEKKVDQSKTWIEIAAVPLTVALTGAAVTWFITKEQITSTQSIADASASSASTSASASMAATKEIARANLAVAEKSAASEQRLKAFELCVKYVTDKDPSIRESGVRLLALLDPELAEKIRSEVLASEKNPQVREAAKRVQISGWFPVIGSVDTLEAARRRATQLLSSNPTYAIHVYQGTDNKGMRVFALTLGGYLSRAEAEARIAYAKHSGIAKDAFITEHANWGQNLLQ